MTDKLLLYFSVWDFMRWFRLGAGIFMLIGAAFYMQFLPALVGGIFVYQAFTNTGCCNASYCALPEKSKSKTKF